MYAVRENEKGFAFSEDTTWQKEFEDSFIYEETSPQSNLSIGLNCSISFFISLIALSCEYVGYGKTEVALRAAFKAMMDVEQVW